MYKIEINNQRKIGAVQTEFNEFFPHLKIEFYTMHPSSIYERIKEYIDQKKTIDTCRNNNNNKNGFFYFHEEMKANELKQSLKNEFGLNVDIFHKIGREKWSNDPIPNNQLLKEINFEIQ
jgi:hypothetical protein